MLAAAGAVLTVAGLVLAVTGRSLDWTQLGVSAQNPMRVMSEGLFALLCAAALQWNRCDRRTALALTALLAAFHASLAGASHPRRVGDGHEYIAMARQLSVGSAPALSPSDLAERPAEIARQPGYDFVDLRETALIGRDGRQDLVHFWLYPLGVAPLLWLTSHADLHWNLAFAAGNVALLAGLAYVALLELPVAIVLVLVAGPVIWWVDKAQVEVFNVALSGLAMLLLRRRPAAALLALAILSAQNPAFLVVLLPAAIAAVLGADSAHRRRVLVQTAAALAIAAIGPAYYLAHLGRPSPLADGTLLYWPTLTALLTPLVDPFCGMLWLYPGLVASLALAVPAARRGWREPDVLLAAWSIAAFLFVFAMTGNVNHGGTAGPSRYGLWLVPFTIPLLARIRPSGTWSRVALSVVAIASMAHAMWAFHPRQAENSTSPPRGAAWLMERWPALYDPLPEVFAERYARTEQVSLPLSSDDCGKVLLAGEGSQPVRWPIPCRPSPAPAECATAQARCYASRGSDGHYSFSVAPRQPSFRPALADDVAWTSAAELDWMPVAPRWDRLRRVTQFGPASVILGGKKVRLLHVFQDGAELVALLRTAPAGTPALKVAVSPDRDVWVIARSSRQASLARSGTGNPWVPLPRDSREALIVLLVQRR